MPVGAMIFLAVVFVGFSVFDIILLISLLRPGDERNQIIVWKASSFTLLASIGSLLLDVVENLITKQYSSVNPFVHLEVIAIVYFAALMYYKKRHGG